MNALNVKCHSLIQVLFNHHCIFRNYVTGLQAAAISEDSTKKLSVDSSKAYPSGCKDKLRRADSSNSLNTSYSRYGIGIKYGSLMKIIFDCIE